MNKYAIEYRNRNDEFGECYRFYVEAFDADDAVARFRELSPKSDSEIIEVARIIKKDFTKR